MSIRAAYEEYGVEGYYKKFGADYRNPHEPLIEDALLSAHAKWDLPLTRVLDLACGSGEVTLALRTLGANTVVGCDPYTSKAYWARTGKMALPYSFEEIAQGALREQGGYSLIVCSYAMHLVAKSWMFSLCRQLSLHSARMLLLSPHAQPDVKLWNWVGGFTENKVRVRYFAR